ncbi:hypothetical protein LPU83_pLPU83d_0598 (plasmid) [Rhizobium favelukesii]|uniref:Uncharacterized protein n=1 Tax=Rhizobium favelukesii TaxID=348824 RepID=W6RMI4_9HYPH|nr:hypothetical protein LPU83_pLPU83d_0598 [Rhizobium favelukesii]
MRDPCLKQSISLLPLKECCVPQAPEIGPSCLVPEVALREFVANVCLDMGFEIHIVRALRFEAHRMRDASKPALCEFPCAGIDDILE